MRKVYKKPEMYIENFEVSEFIAGSCGIDLGFSADKNTGSCKSYDFGGINLFGGQIGCGYDYYTFDLNENDKPCYDIPTDFTRIFGS